jgi:hypothetical protein
MPASDDSRPPSRKHFDIPDLDLPPARKSGEQPAVAAPARVSATAARAQPQASSLDYFGAASFDADDAGGGRLDLDDGEHLIGGTSGADGQALFGAGSFEADDFASGIDLDGAGAGAPVAGLKAGAPLAIAAAEPASLEARGGAAESIAGWGPPPKSVLGAPAYAWRVFVGRRALQKRVFGLTRALEVAELERDRKLSTVAESLRPALESDARFARMLEPILVLERAASERQQALASANAEYAAELAKRDARLAPAREEVLQRRAAERALESELAAASESAARAEARHKRALIELRNADESTRRAAGLPPEAPERVQALVARAAELQAEHNAAVSARDAARAKHDAGTRASAEAERAVDKIEAERRALDANLGKKLNARAHDAERAERDRLAALAQIGRELLERRSAISLDASLVAAADSAEQEVSRKAADHELHLRAFDSCDEASVKRGWAVLVALLGALLLCTSLLVL